MAKENTPKVEIETSDEEELTKFLQSREE